MGFQTRELIFIALMAALLFVVNFSIGEGIIVATGIPGASGFITGITNVLFITFVALNLRKFGAVSLLYLVYGIIALPTHMAGGPPGFILKIPVLVLIALSYEIIIYFARFKKIGFIIGLPIFVIFGMMLYLGTYYLLGMPEFNKMYGAALTLTIVFTIFGYLGLWLGFLLYNRLKDKRIIRQITN